jgi:hypothetical protein
MPVAEVQRAASRWIGMAKIHPFRLIDISCMAPKMNKSNILTQASKTGISC